MRLIDADALMDNISKKPSLNLFIHAKNIEAAIDETPTIDAEPVRHGRWMNKGYITTAYGSIDTGDCSVCGAVDVPIEPYDSHCPNCGAKMGEVQDD